MAHANDTTEILAALCRGEDKDVHRLAEMVYDELRQLAASYLSRENPGHLLQPTALVHEAFLRLARQEDVSWQGRSHFLAIGAQAMRRILVDQARARLSKKRGGGGRRVSLNENMVISTDRMDDVLALDESIQKLESLDPVDARIVELRFFAGMNMDEIAEAVGKPKRTVERKWTAIRAWLRRELSEEQAP
jgi:RNA polymerase sigma factor (TIGR02999 family)